MPVKREITLEEVKQLKALFEQGKNDEAVKMFQGLDLEDPDFPKIGNITWLSFLIGRIGETQEIVTEQIIPFLEVLVKTLSTTMSEIKENIGEQIV